MAHGKGAAWCMAHRYGHPIHVTCAAGQPSRFSWRDAQYTVAEVLATWHLRDRWWAQPGDGTAAASDRYYYRIQCMEGLLCDLYYDAARDAWVLDRVHD
jgi:hypothetical protein